MQNPRAFLSFDFDNDETYRMLFAGQAKTDSPTPFTLEDWSSKRALPQAEWENLISNKINKCDLMIVLVGKNMTTASGVQKEISFAKTHDVPYFGVYVNGANNNSNLPSGLARNRTIPWTWAGIENAIKQMLTEGKHRKEKQR